ncbi:P-loop NTPase fold protein [Lentzea sp. JNUCC 0626]|uniref:KAP family P-loop NTPase fold protein n=1 Tax=Lentzea sp. JNUCC 0626 TaxID=3367513 RepID=UPI003748143E
MTLVVVLTSDNDVFMAMRRLLDHKEEVRSPEGYTYEVGTLSGGTKVVIGGINTPSPWVKAFAPPAISLFSPTAVVVVTSGEPHNAPEHGVLVATGVHEHPMPALMNLMTSERLDVVYGVAVSGTSDDLPEPSGPYVIDGGDAREAAELMSTTTAPILVVYKLSELSADTATRFAMALAAQLSGEPVVARQLKTMGHGDQTARTDLLARQAYVQTLAELLKHPGEDAEAAGPKVIAIEGAWGSGKSTLMEMTQDLLDTPDAWDVEVGDWRQRRVAAWDADLMLRGWLRRPWLAQPEVRPRVLTARFNPWSAQTGEHVWAGLSDCIVATGAPVIARESHSSLQRFWFWHNVEQLDRSHLQRTLRKRLLSPVLRLAVFALPVPVLVQVLRTPGSVRVFGFDLAPPHLALWIVVLMLLAGVLHTLGRYLFRAADTVLPAELFGPSGALGAYSAAVGTDDPVRDPRRRARKGQLLSAREDVHRLVQQLGNSGTRLVVFIDDLDRCTPRTTAEVFEAINGFLVEPFPAIRFVLGIDAAATAAHLDAAYSALVVSDPADPSPGWTFMRKLIQLPLPVPRVARTQVEPLLEGLLGKAPERPVTTQEEVSRLQPFATATARIIGSGPVEIVSSELVVDALEHDERVQARFVERLKAQPDLSVREAKRIVTVWMFYVRVLTRIRPEEGTDAIDRACELVLLAEIVARWPASQRNLHRRVDGVHGLRALADTANDNVQWEIAVKKHELDGDRHKAFRKGVLAILSEYDRDQIADLAELLT